MRAAGIPPADWPHVDFVIQHESGWNPAAVNPSSGACGLAQFLPCSVAKAGADWADPVSALRRADAYARSRYGGWAGSHQAWIRQGWW